jgi:hypothetical protein
MLETSGPKVMTTYAVPLTVPMETSHNIKKKRVLLVDTCTEKRELRADAMHKLGVDVDCASDIDEARSWWRPDLYDLILMNVENETGSETNFVTMYVALHLPNRWHSWWASRNILPVYRLRIRYRCTNRRLIRR